MLSATFQTGVQDLKPELEKNALLRDAGQLVALHEELEAEETRLAARRMELARQYAQPPDEHRTVEEEAPDVR